MSQATTTQRPAGEQTTDAAANHARRWWILAVRRARPADGRARRHHREHRPAHAQHALGFSNADRQWVVTALLAGLRQPAAARRTARRHRSAASGRSSSGWPASPAPPRWAGPRSASRCWSRRVPQGAFGALLAPAALPCSTTTFSDPGERGKGVRHLRRDRRRRRAVGLLLGGLLTQYLAGAGACT